MKKFTYKTKDGRIIESDKPLKEPGLKLVTQIRDGRMKSAEVTKK